MDGPLDMPLDLQRHDPELVDEIRMVTELMLVATTAPGQLEQQVIDRVLGVEPVRWHIPEQRQRT
jgi:hypothetical protein